MNSDVKLEIKIYTSDLEEATKISRSIHEQLRENKDYLNNRILFDHWMCEIKVQVLQDCTDVPTFVI